MNTVSRKQLVQSHGKKFVHAVLEKTLVNSGFVSLDGEGIHWCRVIDGRVIQAIYFYVRNTGLPAAPMLGYASHPLFLTPAFPRGFYIYGITEGLETFNTGKPFMKAGVTTKFFYSDDILVQCPKDDYYGEDVLRDLIGLLDKIQTEEDCYQMHKDNYLYRHKLHNKKYMPYQSASIEFMAEAVYFNDCEILPFCEQRIHEWIAALEENMTRRKLVKYEEQQMKELLLLKQAIIGGERDAYLSYLKENEKRVVRTLKRRAGIDLQ